MTFKNSFSKVSKFINKSASNVVQKSNDLIEISRLKGEINGEEKKKEIICASIGKLVYKNYISKMNKICTIVNTLYIPILLLYVKKYCIGSPPNAVFYFLKFSILL